MQERQSRLTLPPRVPITFRGPYTTWAGGMSMEYLCASWAARGYGATLLAPRWPRAGPVTILLDTLAWAVLD